MEPVQSLSHRSYNLEDQLHRKQGMSMVSADMGLVSMVRQGILALQLLPPNSSAGRFVLCPKLTFMFSVKCLLLKRNHLFEYI